MLIFTTTKEHERFCSMVLSYSVFSLNDAWSSSLETATSKKLMPSETRVPEGRADRPLLYD